MESTQTTSQVFLSKKISSLIPKIDFSRLGSKVGIKVHFGEMGCTTYTDPKIVKEVYDKIISLGKSATLIESNVLYKGSRTNATDHKKTAQSHGFNFAPIDILDGEKGNNFVDVKIRDGVIHTAKIGKGLEHYDSLVVISHFKGHMSAGYGGIFKNLGMGIGSRAGKLQMHASVSPSIDQESCTGCETCMKGCDFNAITMQNDKAQINKLKCASCAMCIALCPFGAVQIPWRSSTTDDLQKRIVDYSAAIFTMIPISKCIFINVLEKITKDCDCMNMSQKPLMDDIGILFGYDPVAIDKASLDLAIEKSHGKFDKINSVNRTTQTNYAEKRGLGTTKYSLVNIN